MLYMNSEYQQATQEMEGLLYQLLWSLLQSLGLFREKHVVLTDLREQAGISASYDRWLEESIAFLEYQHYLHRPGVPTSDGPVTCTVEDPALLEGVTLWQQWDKHKENWMQNADLKAQVVLVETALRALPAILTGKCPAVEVLFPNGSMHLVEGIYQHNVMADYFNDVLAGLVVTYLQERLTHEEQARIRILEIGAGTGGTTNRVLQCLQPYQASIAEYCYSDISDAFLRYGQRMYAAEHFSLTYRLVNVEKPLAEQGIEEARYDLVIATNVLHATSNIRRTVRNAKAALKKHGWLLLNEITGTSLFSHLTFGLLPGWWAYEDAELRVPGCPALSAESWKTVLNSEGLRAISVPVLDRQEADQQVIVAESDGIIRQEHTPRVGTGLAPVRQTLRTSSSLDDRIGVNPVPTRFPLAEGPTDRIVFDHVQSIILEGCAEVLKMQESEFEEDKSFAEYGVDSLMGINLINVINQKSHLTLPTTVLFDYNTVEHLRQYILREHSATLRALLQERALSGEVRSSRQSISMAQSSNGETPWRRFAREGVASVGTNLVAQDLTDAVASDRKGASPSSTQWHGDAPEESQSRSVDDGFVPSRPLRAPVPPATYQRVIVQRPGEIDDLTIMEAELPALKDHEVRIAVYAFSLNFGDLLCVKGLYPTMPPYPFTPGFEASGVVLAVGRAVAAFQAGDAVMAMAGATLGGQASVMTCSEEQVFHKPGSLTFEEACALPAVAITMIATFEKARLKPGEKILIQTATGGTGLIAIQLANSYRAEIYATAGSQSKLDYLKQLGVPYRINYQETDFEQEIERLTAGKGVDVVINTLSGDAIQKGINCLAAGGRYIEIAMTALKSARTIDLSVLSRNQTFYSVDLRRLALEDPTTFKEYGREMLHLVEKGIITPTIGQVFAWESLKDAYRSLENRQNIGKVVVRLPQTSPAQIQVDEQRQDKRLARAVLPSVIPQHEPIAIIGMSGRFAGSENVSELWEHLAKGTDLVKEVTRWDVADLARTSGETSEPYCKHGSFLEGIDLFDPLFFNIGGAEATYMDPQQRLVLEEAWKALEDAGYVGKSIEGRQCGVYIGCSAGDYQFLLNEAAPAQAFWGNAGSVIPARIAYYLNLQGPAIAIDTACSSSLVAMHVACQGLWSGEIEMALAGGVFVQCTPQFYQRANRAGMLSVTGRCSTFDDCADGFVPGEGVGVVVLKRLKDALASGDHIYGVIAGSGINQDGATRGITAPSVNSQERLLRSVYETFQIEPSQIQMMEAHGTGTRLGDPIEFEALTRVFRQETERGAYCALGSIKSNLGHTATAAGVAGVLKILLALQHKQIPPLLHFESGNSHIEWEDSPFYVNTRLQDWPEPNEKRRYAAVSSFGFSGTNAHLVIEEAPEHARRHGDSPGYLIVLSARTAEQLRQQAEQLVTFCEQAEEIDCGNMSYTLLLGRKHLKHRLACVVGSCKELVAHLRKWLEKGKVPQISVSNLETREQSENVSLKRYGNQCIEDCRQISEAESYLEHLSTIADLYLQGYVLAYERLFRDAEYGRISLPTYPFARERYWVPTPQVKPRESRTAATVSSLAPLHPLVQQNSSDFFEQKFSSTFRGDEFFLVDHVVKGQRVMPGVAYLEMARAAIDQAMRGMMQQEGHMLCLEHVVWIHPLVVDKHSTTVHITLSPQENGAITFLISRDDAGTVPYAHPGFASQEPEATGDQVLSLLCQGRVVLSATKPTPLNVDLAAVQSRCQHPVSAIECYQRHRKLDISYGPTLQGIEHLSIGEGEVLARLRLPVALGGAQIGTEGDPLFPYVLHPSVLDSALQACIGFLMKQSLDPELHLPFELEELSIMEKVPAQGWAWVRRRFVGVRTEANPVPASVFDIEVCDDEGRSTLRLRGLSTRRLLSREVSPAGQDGGVLAPSLPLVGYSPNSPADAPDRRKILSFSEPPRPDSAGKTDELLREKSIAYLKGLVGKVLDLPSAKIDAATPLTEYGLDSLLVLQLTNILREDMEQISSTLLFEYATIDALVEHFLHTQKEALERLVGVSVPTVAAGLVVMEDIHAPDHQQPVQPKATVSHLGIAGWSPRFLTREKTNGWRDAEGNAVWTRQKPRTAPTDGGEDIAIIGLTGRYPGAPDLLAFWDLLKAGKSGIREIPASRWDWRQYFQAEKGATYGASLDQTIPTMYTKWGGFLQDIECFDAPFFHISPREAEQIDPQERLFLEVSYACIEDAGYTPLGLQEHGPVGVFVGVMNGNYPTGARYWSVANRVSFALGLQGPSMAIDTACSSSLTALHCAVESLISGTSVCAIVGGVNLIVDPVHYVRLSEVKMLSASDQCKSFGEGADGFVDGEGVGAMLLKPLLQAEADGDHIYGVIKGTAINHGGKTNGYTVPNPQAQAKVIEQALQRAGIDPRTISYIEAHGTGTELGDPIEIAGLARAWASACVPCAAGGAAADQLYCAVGSVKSNIGHAESAAGIAGVTKVLLQMRYGQLVPSLHAEVLNPHIDFSATPFVVQQELTEWKRSQENRRDRVYPCPRRAGISSFGAGGSNAHVILEEYLERQQANNERKENPSCPALIVLSARTQEQLHGRVQQLLTWISVGDGDLASSQSSLGVTPMPPSLQDLAYTLQVGREAMEERLALQVNSLQELEEKLCRYVGGEQEGGDWYRGQVKRQDVMGTLAADEDGQNMVATWIRKGKYEKLLACWVKGLTIDWKLLYTDEAGFASALPRRISLPTYPFARERYWISTSVRTGSTQGLIPTGAYILHPFVQYNTSTLWEQRFSSTFYGDEFFLADHVVKGQRMMPGVAYLEMARAAIDQAMGSPEQDEGRILRLRQVAWARPLVIDGPPITVHITLSPQENGMIAFLISRDGANDPRRDRGFARSSDPFPDEKPLSAFASQTLAGSKDPLSLLCQGRALVGQAHKLQERTGASQNLDLPALQSHCRYQISAPECYQRYRELGITYGPALQGIEQLALGEEEVLARFREPSVALGLAQRAQTHADYVLHPSVLDAALQACIGFLMEQNANPGPHLPFALEELSLLGKVPTQGWAWVRRRSADVPTEANPMPAPVFDIDVCDDEGSIAVRLRGLSTRRLLSVGTNVKSGADVVLETDARKGHDGFTPLQAQVKHMDSPAGMLLACTPLWNPVALLPVAVAPEDSAKGIAIIGGTAEEQRAILDFFPYAHVLEIPMGASIESLAELLAGAASLPSVGSIEQVFWLASCDCLHTVTEESILSSQQEGVLACFRLIKAFLQLGYGSRRLHWTVITRQTRVLRTSESAHPTHASLLGLFGALTKEYPHWIIQQADLPIDAPLPVAEVQRLPADPQGHGWFYRSGHWYREILVPLDTSSLDACEAYRRGGVYVVIGGAGGIGEVWSEYLICRYQAQVIWIGRRRADAEIRASQERLAALGPKPHYITADATNHNALQQAYAQIKQNFSQIHGVVHSAIVLLDQSLAKMDEERFQAALAAKVEVSVRLAQVFSQESLDFVLFFSSLNAFVCPAGQSNYAAGCTFEDAFAARLRQEWSCKVKVMNWGYWGSVGVVSSASYQQRMEQVGVGSIEPAEAMQALEGLLAGPVDQMVLFKTTQPILSGPTPLGELIQTQQRLTIYPELLPSLLHHVVPTDLCSEVQREPALIEARQGMQEIEELLCKLLWSYLQSLGLFREKYVVLTDLREQAGIGAGYERWLKESIALLERQHYLHCSGVPTSDEHVTCTVEDPTQLESASLWQQWELHKERWTQNANLKAQVALVETTLRALPTILTGKRPAVELLFPNGFMHLVEGIYQHHAVAEYFNDVLTRLVVVYLQERLAHEEQARIRILEIGAGTGGTTSRVLQSLQPYQSSIAEYCYSDISEAFLRHGQRMDAAEHPYMAYRLVNVEKPLAEQGIELGDYDLVIAANVLHATSNIRRTVRNAKAALKKHGLLLLNEITGTSLFSHLTFGLLPGWWAYEDAGLRVPGCPALTAESWQVVLSNEGFRAISIPTQDVQDAQIIVAESDGIIRQEHTPHVGTGVSLASLARWENEKPLSVLANHAALILETGQRRTPTIPPSERVNPVLTRFSLGTEEVTDRMVFDHVQSIILESCAEVLKMREGDIEEDKSFAEYGVDSIIGINLINVINEKSHLTLPTTVLFDYNTVEQLHHYILREHSAALKALLQERAQSREVLSMPMAQSSNGLKPWRRFALGREGAGDRKGREGASPSSTHRHGEAVEESQSRGVDDGFTPSRPLRSPAPTNVLTSFMDVPVTYQRVIVQGPGGIDDLLISEAELPELKEHEVRIAVHAFSLNFGDLLCVKGLYPTMPPYPFTPGFEVSGMVLAVGRAVTTFQAGDEVMAMAGTMLGGQASVMTCPEEYVFHKPGSLSFEEACALPVVAITMIAAFEKARLKRGEKILIQTAAGGTGLIGVQLAHYYQAEIYATAGSQSKLDYLKQLGVPYRINYQAMDFEQEIERLTSGKGVDVVINTLSGDAIQKGMNCLSPGGRYIEIAMTALKSARTIDLSILSQNQTFYSVDLRKLAQSDPATFRHYCDEMLRLVEEGIIAPTIGHVFDWESLKDAYRYLENRQNIGKVVVCLPQASSSHMRTSGQRREERLAPAEVPSAKPDHELIAIIGMSGRFAGSGNVSELWEHLAKGTDLVEEVTRWDLADLAPSSAETSEPYCKHGSFLDGIDLFDPLFFNIGGEEATYMDPQQRLVLEEAWKALEDAGYVGNSMEGRSCGVYIGCAAGDYRDLFDGEPPAQAFWGNAGSVIPARIAYYLNLQGPAIAIDTACSSSLVAMHVACQGLWGGETDMALAGGVFLQCTPQFYQAANRAGMLSVTGHCSTFDNRADGFVPGEGIGIVVLKRLKDALTSGDHIYGVIRGSGINQDGTTRGITAPSANSQERLLRSVYETFQIEPSQIQMVEAHGTGTRLGDPIEFEALTRAFRTSTDRCEYCALGSIKSNLGHTATAAGVAGVLKILLSLQHKQIPPSLHFESGNSHIEWEGSPFSEGVSQLGIPFPKMS